VLNAKVGEKSDVFLWSRLALV